MLSHRRKRPHRMQPIPEHPPRMVKVLEQALRPRQHRPTCRIKVLVHRHVHRIEQVRILPHRHPAVRRRQIQPRPIQMHSNPPLPRPLRYPLHLAEIECLTRLPPHRSLNLDRPNRHRHPPRRSTRGFPFQILHRERRLARSQRHQMQSAQRLATIPAVVEQVGLVLHHHPAPVPSQRPHGHMIGQRPGG